MKTLGDLFSSAAKTEILRALHHQPDAVSLRQLARLAGVRVRSAELALDSLVNEKVVWRRRTRDRVFYAMERSHPSVSVLTAVFDAAVLAAIRANRRSSNERAKRILPYLRQAHRMLNHARASRHGA
jgi:hypothetical protein